MEQKLAIIGAGNIGLAITRGLVKSGKVQPQQVTLTRRRTKNLAAFKDEGFHVTADNAEALEFADLVLICVEPQHVDSLFVELKPMLKSGKHTIVSVVSGLELAQLRQLCGDGIDIVRAMPNTATGIGASMTCLAADDPEGQAIVQVKAVFDLVGACLVIQEEKMSSATALAACGIAFFLRMIRAASQGGIEIGFHPETALLMAAQTAKGAASLLLEQNQHPEHEIDRVTTPRGCTIAGLNQMEHEGLSSAIIKGIVTSATKADGLYKG